MTDEATPPVPEIWVPKSVTPSGAPNRVRAAINIVGESGMGKSYCAVRQFVTDPGYGPKEVLVGMVEDSTITYGQPLPNIQRLDSIADALELVLTLKKAAELGKRVPKLFVLDDLSNLAQRERQRYESNPILVERKDGTMVPDLRATAKAKGYEMIDLLMAIRTDLPMDSFTLVRGTTGKYYKTNPDGNLELVITGFELAMEGYIVPKHLSGHSALTLRLTKETINPTVQAYFKALTEKKLYQPHRKVALTEGEAQAAHAAWSKAKDQDKDQIVVDTMMINRYFTVMNDGEFQGKDHWALRLKEKAYLPDILRKIHGEKPLYL